MYLLITSLIFAAVAKAAETGTGRCHVYKPCNPATACDHVATLADCTEDCGDSIETACISTMQGVKWGSEDCLTCYKVTLTNNFPDDEACPDVNCKPFTRTVYLRIVDGNYNDEKFEMGQMAWKKLCPHLCTSSEQCVDDPEDCLGGITAPAPPGDDYFWGSCHCSKKSITWEKVECEKGTPTPPDQCDDEPEAPEDDDTTVPAEETDTVEVPTAPVLPPGGIEAQVGPSALCPGHVGACEDALPNIKECGKSKEDPCPASATKFPEVPGPHFAGYQRLPAREDKEDGDVCDACMLISYEQEEADSTDCKDGKCPALDTKVFVKIMDAHAESNPATILVGTNGWDVLCPKLCVGTSEYCVASADSCESVAQDIPNTCVGTMPGSSTSKPKKMTIHSCDDSSATLAVPSVALIAFFLFISSH